jgi:succinate dehydrogenase hydrophobic anchor subunit
MRESKLWFWHIITAAIVLVLLGIHMFIMHLGAIMGALGLGSGHATASDVVFQRSQQGLFMVTYIILLGAALFHGLYGLRSMLYELSFSKAAEKAIGMVCALAGVGLFIYGSYAAVIVFTMEVAQ